MENKNVNVRTTITKSLSLCVSPALSLSHTKGIPLDSERRQRKSAAKHTHTHSNELKRLCRRLLLLNFLCYLDSDSLLVRVSAHKHTTHKILLNLDTSLLISLALFSFYFYFLLETTTRDEIGLIRVRVSERVSLALPLSVCVRMGANAYFCILDYLTVSKCFD